MNKKITLFALAAVSAAVLALPSMAMAVEEDIPIHVTPKPTSISGITGGLMTLESKSGLRVTCLSITGSAIWETSTTGRLTLEFQGDCTENLFGTACGTIRTTELPFHLVTLPSNVPGVLVTPLVGHFATFTCTGGFVKVAVTGNGVVGKFTSPSCNGETSTPTLKFEQAFGGQSQKQVAGTATQYHLDTSVNGGANQEAGLGGSGTILFEGKKKLECT